MTDAIENRFFITELLIDPALRLLYRFAFHGTHHIRCDSVLIRNVKIHRHTVGFERTSCGGNRHLCKPDAVALFKHFLYSPCNLCDLLYILDLSVYHSALQVRNALCIGDTEYLAVHISQHPDNRPCSYIKCKNGIPLRFQRLFSGCRWLFCSRFLCCRACG